MVNPLTLTELLQNRCQSQPDRQLYTFLVDGETEEKYLTYQALVWQAQSIGATLQSLVKPGERALLLYPPGLDYIAAFFGCLYAGVVAVPVYPPDLNRLDRTLPRLEAIVRDAQPAIALTTTPILALVSTVLAQMPGFSTIEWLATDVDLVEAVHWKMPPIDGDTVAFLQYTSGSTAAPKGVMLTHHNLLHNSALIYECFGHSAESQGVIWLPPYHDMGLIGGILQPLYGDFPVTLMSPIDFLKRPFRWLQAISRYKATTSGGPNFAYDLCLRKITPEQLATLDLSSWDLAFNGAEPVRYDTMEKFAAVFGPRGFRQEAFYPCYGLAEATLIVSGGTKERQPAAQTIDSAFLRQNRVEKVATTQANAVTLVGCGHTLTEQQILIVDPNTLHPCPSGHIGEIWVCGPSVAQGYWQQPEATQEAFQAHLAEGGEGTFLRTGDLGFLQDGELFIAGRLKDLIVIRGRNYYPQDIELTVERSHPGLRPGCGAAFSVDIAGEERLVMAQEISQQALAQDLHEITNVIRQAITAEHELQVYTVLLLQPGSIPKTSSGKIQRHVCRAAFLSKSLDVVSRSTLEESTPPIKVSSTEAQASFIRKALLTIQEPAARHSLLTFYLQEQVARVLNLPTTQIDVEQPQSTAGLDVLKHELETNLGVVLSEADFRQAVSISQLASQVLCLLPPITMYN